VIAARWRVAATAATGAVLLGLALAACGTPSPDLFVVDRDGTVPGAKLTLLVSDTSVRCNGLAPRPLSSAATIDARELNKDLLELQNRRSAPPTQPRAQIFHFSVRTEKGTLRYPDTAQRPSVLPRLTLFVRRTAIGTCGLKR
jgi:hypothetical protein